MTQRIDRKEAADFLMTALDASREAKDPDMPVFVAVVGGSASGKGHLIDELLARLNVSGRPPDRAAVLPLDNYYLGASERASRGAPHFDHPAAVDLSQAAEQLSRMRVGKTMMVPRYDFSSGERAGEESFTARPFVLVDGLFALYAPELRALSDYSVFIDSDHYSSMLRRLFRDPGPGGRTKQTSREVLEQYFTQVWPAKKAFVDPTAAHAHLIVDSVYDPASESVRAGPMQYQLKARAPKLSDDAMAFLSGATRLGGEIRQVDRFMRLKGSDAHGDILRLRLEPDVNDEVLLTYKGPLAGGAGPRSRPVSSAVALPREALRWFLDDYAVEATIEKQRVLYQAGAALIARDRVKNLGNFVEVRAGADALPSGRLRKLLEKLCPGEPQTDASYLDLWRSGLPLSISP